MHYLCTNKGKGKISKRFYMYVKQTYFQSKSITPHKHLGNVNELGKNTHKWSMLLVLLANTPHLPFANVIYLSIANYRTT